MMGPLACNPLVAWPASSFHRWLRQSVPHFLIEVDASCAPPREFSTHLLEEGWNGLFLEQDGNTLRYLKDRWRTNHRVSCVHFDTAQEGAARETLTTTLANLQVPGDFGLLLLNCAAHRMPFIADLHPTLFWPWVIALKDEGESADARFSAYELLTTRAYHFAGVEQDFSVWTRSDSLTQIASTEFSSLPAPIDQVAGRAYFDKPTNTGRLAAAGGLDLEVSGWAFIDEERSVSPLVYIETQDLRTGIIEYVRAVRYPRPDVCRHFGQPDLVMCGFQTVVPMRGGSYPNGLRLRVVQCDGKSCYRCETELTIDHGVMEFEETARQGLARKFLRGSGIEIGALQRKLELPPTCRVRYVDRLGMPDLLIHYPELQQFSLQVPDLLDDGECLGKITGNSLDFVIANHFFEHSENPIRTLKTLLRVLKPHGILFMAVPDKRYTFDALRPSTSFDTLKETYRTGIRSDRVFLYHEWVEFVEMQRPPDLELKTRTLLDGRYSIHFNVWTADELFAFLAQVRQDFDLPFTISATVCADNEVILILERSA